MLRRFPLLYATAAAVALFAGAPGLAVADRTIGPPTAPPRAKVTKYRAKHRRAGRKPYGARETGRWGRRGYPEGPLHNREAGTHAVRP